MWRQGQEQPENVKKSREKIVNSRWTPPRCYAREGQERHGKEYMQQAIEDVFYGARHKRRS